MIPSQARTSPRLPSFDYHIKHSFAWPPHSTAGAGPGVAAGEAANLAGDAGAAEAALSRKMYWQHYHGRGWGRPRFGMGRRFIWFGLGALAATWYYKHHEQKRQHERAIAYPTTAPNSSSSTAQEPSYASGHWKHEWSWPAPGQSTPPQYKPFTPPPHTPTSATPAQPQTEAQIKSTILAELQSAGHPAEPEVKPAVEERSKRWGWGGRHRRHRENIEQDPAPASNVTGSPNLSASRTEEVDQDELKKKLREAVETMWEDRKTSALQAQEKVNEQARAYAKQKVDKLSAALEALRDSLESETDKKIRKASEKMV